MDSSSQAYSYAALSFGGTSIWKMFLLRKDDSPLKSSSNSYQKYIDDLTSRHTHQRQNHSNLFKKAKELEGNIHTLAKNIFPSYDKELIFTKLLKETKEEEIIARVNP